MQLMVDAIAVVGSRHGIMINPLQRSCSVVRFDRFTRQVPCELRLGVIIEGKEYVLPLTRTGEALSFYDQRTTPCSIVLMGIHAASCIKLRAEFVAPFRPRDAAFSTTPVIGIRLTAEAFAGIFRWEKRPLNLTEAEIFVEIVSDRMTIREAAADAIDLRFDTTRSAQWPEMKDAWDAKEEKVPQHDRLVAPGAQRVGTRFTKRVKLDGADGLDVLWCTWNAPTFDVRGARWPFKFAEQFASLDAVCTWARANPAALFDNAAQVDGKILDNTLSQSVNNLLAYTLHSWAINTWWCTEPRTEAENLETRNSKLGTDFFGVWEGLCYMTSTLDVEFTQAPFYLAVWPELLAIELDHWTHYTKPGTNTLGPRGAGTAYFSHDMGAHACADRQVYSHDMEVEETANWIIMACCHWRRTGDDTILRKHAAKIPTYLAFLERCDTTGNGVPDVGVANTIDDASPAIQFGREQVYLAVKTMAAFVAGATMLEHLGGDHEHYRGKAAAVARVIETQGWLGEQYATLLQKRGVLKNPWTGKEMVCEEIPGWNAPQIYTTNALGLLDMVGIATPLDQDKLRRELVNATARCLREYGCVHSDFRNQNPEQLANMLGLAGVARSPGWISMNMARDIAAFYRGVDLRHLADRYWAWQTTTNTQEPKMFFETFAGNNLCFYPRGVAIWGYLDAVVGRVIDRVAGLEKETYPLGQIRSPRLLFDK